MSSLYGQRLIELEARGRLRSFRPLTRLEGCWVDYEGHRLLNLTSNDYLGLAADTSLQQGFYEGLNQQEAGNYALGAASSRLLTGDSGSTDPLMLQLPGTGWSL